MSTNQKLNGSAGWVTMAALGLAFVAPSAIAKPVAADSTAASGSDIIVTARRTEERLQDVPISITVFNQQQLNDRNVTIPSELATYTPSLTVNNRYGPEKSTFALRGFNQDMSTAPTVGVYFADVVGLRAQGGTSSGNSVGAGAFTDLQNVQVLKGPQGTLFGRNTTGGAVLLVPQKPKAEFGGYIEGTVGNFDAKRIQGAINIPVGENFRMRLAADHNQRDGYQENKSGIGPKDYSDLNYTYLRFSAVADLAPNLENYFIATYSDSDTHGYAAKIELCNPNQPAIASGRPSTAYATALAACDQIARAKARGDDEYAVDVNNTDPYIKLKQWQTINTTTWEINDELTLKNIISYGEFQSDESFSLNSDNFFVPTTPTAQAFTAAGWVPGARFQYIDLGVQPGAHNASQSTFTEEAQLQGTSFDNRLKWVAGVYYEKSDPITDSAGRASIYGNCTDAEKFACTTPLGQNIISASTTRLEFTNIGYFAQGTYNLTDQWAVTGGIRYTSDEITGSSNGYRTIQLAPSLGGITLFQCNDPRASAAPTKPADCHVENGAKSNKLTYTVDVDYKPTDDLLFYAKYSKGYRQGGLNFTNPGLETWKPESLDTYEAGAKVSLRGALSGFINGAVFYNDFTNQQIFGALIAKPESGLAGGAAIINAGASEIYGVELDASLNVTDNLRFDLGYAYTHSEVKELVTPVLAADSPFSQIIPNGTVGSPLILTPENKLTLTGTYTLPLDENIGKVSLAATYIYTGEQYLSISSPLGLEPEYNLVNLNANWNNVMGSAVSLAAFGTNVTDEVYRVGVGQSYQSAGFENSIYAAPAMYGVRVKYDF